LTDSPQSVSCSSYTARVLHSIALNSAVSYWALMAHTVTPGVVMQLKHRCSESTVHCKITELFNSSENRAHYALIVVCQVRTSALLCRLLHHTHHKYNKEHTLSPFAGLAFNPLDGILQVCSIAQARSMQRCLCLQIWGLTSFSPSSLVNICIEGANPA